MSAFSDFAEEAMVISLEIAGDSFLWNGATISAVIGARALVAAKTSFPGAAYPKVGDTITVTGKKRQVKALANSGLELIAGGSREDLPFVDDPGDPGLQISFGTFTK
jgi:hypothetical protein